MKLPNLTSPQTLDAPRLSLNEMRSQTQDGAATRSRTLDLLITSELLYQLSYGGQNGCEILKNEYDQRNRHPEFYCDSSLAAGRNDTSPLVTTRVTPFCSNRSPPVTSTPRTIPSCDSPPKTKTAAWSCKQCAESKSLKKGGKTVAGIHLKILKKARANSNNQIIAAD